MAVNHDQNQQQCVELRRDFHHFAETEWCEYRTTSKIAEHLIRLQIPVYMGEEISTPGWQFLYPSEERILQEQQRAIAQGADPELVARMDRLPGVVGVIETGRPGPVTALRFDIDALPMPESKEADHRPMAEGFVSVNDGHCHACGHDGHAAIGMVLAQTLMEKKDQLCGTIKLIFQPSEEGGGGARGIVQRGVLDDVQYFFAGHIGLTKLDGKPLLSHGIIGGTDDFLDSRRFNIHYTGKAAHSCGDPHKGKNALLAACHAALGVHSVAPHSEGMLRLNVGTMRAGSARNAIAANAVLELEVRGVSDAVTDYGEERMRAVVQGAAAMYDVQCEIEVIGRTCSAKSDREAIDIVLNCAHQIPWFTEFHPIGSVGGSDDAAEMLRRVQKNGGVGAYIGLGADFSASFHNGRFDFDENVLEPSVELFEKIIDQLHKI